MGETDWYRITFYVPGVAQFFFSFCCHQFNSLFCFLWLQHTCLAVECNVI